MRTAVSDRIFGRIEDLRPTCGFVRGDDGRQYFFIPSYVQGNLDFVDLTVGMRCCFLVMAHPRGLRATGLTIVESESGDAQAHGQPAHS